MSEYATVDQPILKITENPMGLTEFLYDILRKETVCNDEYWYGEYAGKYYQKMMDLIGLTKDSQETFSVSLDSIRVNMPQNGESNVEFWEESWISIRNRYLWYLLYIIIVPGIV